MSKNKRCNQQGILISVSNKRRAIVAFSLALTLALVGGIFTYSRGIPPSVETSAPMMPQSTPTPLILSKEYIYGGSRLLATEVSPEGIATLEGDVTGDGRVAIGDWVLVGRFIAALDTPTPGTQFQRADCAPRSSLGGGTLTTSDWVQAGRYSAGLDPPTYQGGPIARSNLGSGDGGLFALVLPSISLARLLKKSSGAVMPLNSATAAVVRIVSPNFVAGQNGTVIIELDSQGNESGIGISLTFSPSQLTFVSAVKGSDAASGTLNVNSNSASSGRIGLLFSKPTGQTFSSGTRQVVVATFTAATSGSIAISSSNQPVWREVVDVNGNALAATFTP